MEKTTSSIDAVNEKIEKSIEGLLADLNLRKAEDKEKEEDEKKAISDMEDKEEDEKKSKGKGKAEEDEEKKSKGKAEDEEDDEEKKSKGKADDEDEKKEYSEKSRRGLTSHEEALLAKAKKQEADDAVEKEEKLFRSISKLVDAVHAVNAKVDAISKRPSAFRKSKVSDYEVIEKSKDDDKIKMTSGEIMDVMNEMVSKGSLDSIHVCEFNGSGDISDPMVKSQVVARVRERRAGLK